MVKTKRILIALAVIGANMLYTMPVHTALAEYDYTITDGIIVKNSSYSDGHIYNSTIFGNTELGTSALSGIEMVIRDGTYNASSADGSVQMVGSNVGGANISNNHLTINNATINTLYGAYYKYDDYPGVNGTLENNSITIYDGTYRNVYTAYATYGNLTSNILTVEDGTFKQYGNEHIAAGYVYSSGNAISNQFIINGGTFENLKYIYGGHVGSGNVIGNIITINDGTFSDTGNWINIFGGNGEGGDNVDDGNVTKNIVNIKGGSFDNINFSIYGGYLNGNSHYGSISENEVNVSGGTFNAKMSFYGGSLPRSDLNAVSIEKNKVTIKNVTLANGSEIYGGQSSKVKIDSNIVTIDSGTFNNVVIVGGKSQTAEVLNNSVILNGGNFTGGTKIVAGIGVNDNTKFSGNSISLVGNNSLDLSGASLMGYDTTGVANSTLNVGRVNVAVKDIQNFGTIAFDLNGVSSDAVVLKMGETGTAYNLSNLGTATITVNGITLADGDYITLMKNVSGSFGGTVTAGNVTVVGTELVYYTGTTPTAPKADYTITKGTTVINSTYSDAHTYTTEIIGNTELSTSNLTDINMVVRRGTYENTIYAVKYDGDVQTTEISGNKVTIHDGSFKEVYSAYAKNGQVTGNTLTIEDGTFAIGTTCPIYAGYVEENGKVEGNKIFINGGDVGNGKTVAAGYIFGTGDATGNEITITGGKIGGSGFGINIYGTEFNKGRATGNKVNISGGEFGEWVTIHGVLLGANYATAGSADTYIGGNEVNITGGTFDYVQYIYGADAGSYEAKLVENNKVNIKDVTIKGKTSSNVSTIYGGHATDVEVKGNGVTIENATCENVEVYGGWTDNKNAEGNFVTLKSSTFGDGTQIYGAYTDTGNAGGDTEDKGNKVIIDGGSFGVNGQIYGAWVETSGDVLNNKIIIKDGTFAGGSSGTMYFNAGCSFTSGNAKGNSIVIEKGTFGDNCDFEAGYAGSGEANNNYVEINSGSFGNNAEIYGGYSGSGNVKDNTVIVNNGAFSTDSEIHGARSDNGNAENNNVIINDGTFTGCSIYGGSAENVGSDAAIGNSVTINGGIFNNTQIFVGYSETNSSSNILNINTKGKGSFSVVAYAQNMNFTLPSNIMNGDVMLKTENLAVNAAGGTATINVYAAKGTKLKAGDVITLVDVSTSIGDNFVAGDILGGAAELCVERDDAEDKNEDSDQLDLVITLLRDYGSGGDEDQQKAPVEGIAAAVQIVNQSADLASGEGMKSLVSETAGGLTNTFGALTTGQSKYKTGSHVDVDGWGVLVGAGKTKEWGNGEATSLGVFFEYGKGDFDTYNGNVHGDGNSENKGIGFMMRHKMMNNTYYEGNIRFGKQETEWSESEIGSYDTDSKYYGISVGMGHIYQVGKNELDVYGRYTYGHVGACDAKVGDNHYHFDSVKSHRVRVGGKYNFKLKDSNAKPFIGLAWEHEFKGESKASISGVGEAPAPSMKGNTGIMEVGCDWKVSKKWTLGLGANAYIGKRKGWDGMARVFYNF